MQGGQDPGQPRGGGLWTAGFCDTRSTVQRVTCFLVVKLKGLDSLGWAVRISASSLSDPAPPNELSPLLVHLCPVAR